MEIYKDNNSLNRRDFIAKSSTLAAVFAMSGFPNGQSILSKSNQKRKISTLKVSSLGLGCMNMAGIYNGAMPKNEMVAVVRKAFDNAITFFDTAEFCGPFFSEEIVGEAIKPFRNKVSIASKFGFSYDGNRTTGKNSKPERLLKEV